MPSRAQKTRLSIFLISAAAVFALFFFVLVGRHLLEDKTRYYVIYEGVSVQGLEVGAPVRYNGVRVGTVANITITDQITVRVDVEVQSETPIKVDTVAIVTPIGITGLKYIELTLGTPEAEMVEPNGKIASGMSFLDSITSRTEDILEKLSTSIDNLNGMLRPETGQALNEALNSIGGLSAQLDTLLRINREALTLTLENVEEISDNIALSTKKTDEMIQAINTRDVRETFANIRDITDTVNTELDSLQLVDTMRSLRELLDNANQMVVHVDMISIQAREDVLRSLDNLDEALNNLRETSDIIRENPSVLIRGRQQGEDRVE